MGNYNFFFIFGICSILGRMKGRPIKDPDPNQADANPLN